MKKEQRVHENRARLQDWDGPKSICQCGHTGDGLESQHDGTIPGVIDNGHGRCLEAGCKCERFTFKQFTGAFQKAVDQWRKA